MFKLSTTLAAALLAAAAAMPYHPHMRMYGGFAAAPSRFFFQHISVPKAQDLADGAFDAANGAYGAAATPLNALLGGIGGAGGVDLGGVPKSLPIPHAPQPPQAPEPVVPHPPKAPHVPAPQPQPHTPAPSYHTLLHSWVWTSYLTWSYHGHPHTDGLTWGVECKDLGCQTKTGFVGKRNGDHKGFLVHAGTAPAGSTEFSHDYGKVFCPKGSFMSSMNCKDASCTSMELICAPLQHDLRAVYTERWGGVWEKGHRRVYCHEGEYIDGIECVGSCTKHFNIFCSKVERLGH